MSSCERSVVRALAGFLQAGVNQAPLGRRVFTIGGRQFRNDVDYPTGDFELHLVAMLEAGPPPDLVRHRERCFVSYGDSHGDDYNSELCEVSPSP